MKQSPGPRGHACLHDELIQKKSAHKYKDECITITAGKMSVMWYKPLYLHWHIEWITFTCR